MNRLYTITFTEGPNVSLVESTAHRLSYAGMQVQDQGGQSVSFRVAGDTPGRRDRRATLEARDAMAGLSDPWVLATGMGAHRRVVETGGQS